MGSDENVIQDLEKLGILVCEEKAMKIQTDHDGSCQNIQALQKTWCPPMFNQSDHMKPAPKPRCMNEKTFALKTGRIQAQRCNLAPGHAGVHCGGLVWENEDVALSILPPEYTTKPVSAMKKLTTHLLAYRRALEVQNVALKTVFEAAQFFGGVNPGDFDAATQREWKRHVQVLLGIACPAEASAEKKILEEKLVLAGKGTFGRGSW